MRERSVKGKRAERDVALWARPAVWAFRMLLGRPRDSALALVCAIAIGAIVINSLYLQPGPHPAPIFIIKRPPVTIDEPTGTVAALLPRPRPLDAPQPEIRPEAKPRVEASAQIRPQPTAAGPASPRHDPIANLLANSGQLTAIQRTLSEFGYGPLTATGVYGPDTRAAIERFERDRKLPVTGQVSERLVRELSQLVGKPI